jgi:polysaccharide export outer membrane protein
MHHLRPLLALLAVLVLSGCAWAPGQQVRSLRPPADTVDRDQIQWITINARWLAMEAAARETEALPPALIAAPPAPYRIGVGDVLYITVWDHPELTVPAGPQQQLNAAGRPVQADGMLFYPYIGKVQAAGLTPDALREEITRRLARFIEAPQVDVSILTHASQRVRVTGAIRQPAVLPLTLVPLTLADAISQAAIDPAQADLSGIRLTRAGQTFTLDLEPRSTRTAPPTQVYLQADDHIHVPYLERKEVFVLGEVVQPGAIPFKTARLPLSQAIGRARGITQATANADAVYVIRGAPDLQGAPSQVFQLHARSPSAFALASQFELRPGDVVFVGAAGVTRWSRFVNQLLPFTSIISNAASAHNDLGSP